MEFYILLLSLNIVYLFSLALIASFLLIFGNYYNLIRNVIRNKINILHIFLYILLLVLLGFGEFLISFFIVLLKCSLGGPYFTLFTRSYLYLMTVSLIQWRAVIGPFNCEFLGLSKNCNLSRNVAIVFEIVLLCCRYFESGYIFLLTFLYIFYFLHCHEIFKKRIFYLSLES